MDVASLLQDAPSDDRLSRRQRLEQRQQQQQQHQHHQQQAQQPHHSQQRLPHLHLRPPSEATMSSHHHHPQNLPSPASLALFDPPAERVPEKARGLGVMPVDYFPGRDRERERERDRDRRERREREGFRNMQPPYPIHSPAPQAPAHRSPSALAMTSSAPPPSISPAVPPLEPPAMASLQPIRPYEDYASWSASQAHNSKLKSGAPSRRRIRQERDHPPPAPPSLPPAPNVMDVDRERERQPHHANLINGNVHLFPSKTPPPPPPSRPHSQSLPHIAPAPPPEPSGVRQLQPQPTHSSHRRRTPAVPGTPNPPPPPPVLHLGTFVHPSSPFPLISCPPIPPCVSAPQNRSSDPPSTSSFTLLIPANFLPTFNPPPNQLKLWGGFPIYTQAPSPLYPPPLPRRIYTDDSDPVLCAIHSGLVTLTDCRRQLKDLKLHVGIVYQSDLGAKVWKGCYGEQSLETGRSGKGAAPLLRSYDWGSSHDGGGLEILRAEWVEPGTAHTVHLPNLRARLLEYTERRTALALTSLSSAGIGGKRRRENSSSAPYKLAENQGLLFGLSGGIACKYTPSLLSSVLFPSQDALRAQSPSTNPRPRKKRKVDSSLRKEVVAGDRKEERVLVVEGADGLEGVDKELLIFRESSNLGESEERKWDVSLEKVKHPLIVSSGQAADPRVASSETPASPRSRRPSKGDIAEAEKGKPSSQTEDRSSISISTSSVGEKTPPHPTTNGADNVAIHPGSSPTRGSGEMIITADDKQPSKGIEEDTVVTLNGTYLHRTASPPSIPTDSHALTNGDVNATGLSLEDSHVLGVGLSISDVEFTADGICVWTGAGQETSLAQKFGLCVDGSSLTIEMSQDPSRRTGVLFKATRWSWRARQ